MAQTQFKKHGSIPGYRPGPILTRNHKILLSSLIVVPAITYAMMKYRERQRELQEKQFEIEGREMYEKQVAQSSANRLEDQDRHIS